MAFPTSHGIPAMQEMSSSTACITLFSLSLDLHVLRPSLVFFFHGPRCVQIMFMSVLYFLKKLLIQVSKLRCVSLNCLFVR